MPFAGIFSPLIQHASACSKNKFKKHSNPSSAHAFGPAQSTNIAPFQDHIASTARFTPQQKEVAKNPALLLLYCTVSDIVLANCLSAHFHYTPPQYYTVSYCTVHESAILMRNPHSLSTKISCAFENNTLIGSHVFKATSKFDKLYSIYSIYSTVSYSSIICCMVMPSTVQRNTV